MVCCQLILGFLHVRTLGLVISFVVGQAAGVTQLARACWVNDRAAFVGISLRACFSTAAQHWRFPAFSSPAALINAFGTNLPQIAITSMFGLEVGGAYALAMRVFMTPSSLLGQSIAQIYNVELSRSLWTPSGEPERLFRKATMGTAGAGVLIASLALSSPFWFTIIFGRQWDLAASYSLLLTPALWAMTAGSPLFCFHLTGLNSWQLIWDASRLAALALVLWVFGSLHRSAQLVVISTSCVTFVAYSLAILLNLIAIRHCVVSRVSGLNVGA